MEFYHVLNRGIEKKNIVLNDGDRQRFVNSLYAFNDRRPADNFALPKRKEVLANEDSDSRNLLVYIHAWCLMNNHYHLLLSPVEDDYNNISLFMKKLNMGYAKYFNEKYSRTGYLWQGKYKKIHIQRDAHFNYIPYYIHLNPLDYAQPKWRQGRALNVTTALKHLKKYRWSSYLDYIGEENYPSIIHKSILSDTLGRKREQQNEMVSIISDFHKAKNADVIEI